MEKIRFSDEALKSFAVAERTPIIDDAMIVAAAVEYADRTVKRPAGGWRRRFDLRVPVYDLSRWHATETSAALSDVLGFLTGDDWSFEFIKKKGAPLTKFEPRLNLDNVHSVISYSDGMDSKAVAGLVRKKIGNRRLVKVRLGTYVSPRLQGTTQIEPFVGIPYKILIPRRQVKDFTFRSRGFKFFSIAGIAAYLTRSGEIIVPESGQGALGSALVGVAHAYADYRTHPLFTKRMEKYLYALFEREIQFRYPQIWNTKGETLREYVAESGSDDWKRTRSCWRSSRWVSVDGRRRQCGVCAACLLRRMSVYAADLTEPQDTYVTTDLTASNFEASVDPLFHHGNRAFAEYAYAGFLHLDHLAELAGISGNSEVRVHSTQLKSVFTESVDEIQAKMRSLLRKHRIEWEAYVKNLGKRSFLVGDARSGVSSNKGRLSDREIGVRLRTVRERAKINQTNAAKIIDANRNIIVAIENGKRQINVNDLEKLASAYGTSANAILRREAVHLNLVPQFRKVDGIEDAVLEHTIKLFNHFVMVELELENVLEIPHLRHYPQEKPIISADPKSIIKQAENDSRDLREWLGLGLASIEDIIFLLEVKLGIRIYLRHLDSKISGLFSYDERAGACMLLNASHPRSRIATTAAHELGHFITSRKKPEILIESLRYQSKEERYANSFSRSFLMPSHTVQQRFTDITAGQSYLTRRHVILLSHTFGVSREAMVRRLEELGLARKGTWDWFGANGGITNEQERDVLGDFVSSHFPAFIADSLLPKKISIMVGEAWRRGIYSEGQLEDLLDLDRRSVRDLVYKMNIEESEKDDLVRLH